MAQENCCGQKADFRREDVLLLDLQREVYLLLGLLHRFYHRWGAAVPDLASEDQGGCLLHQFVSVNLPAWVHPHQSLSVYAAEDSWDRVLDSA